ncbi:pseudouridine synthase [Dokdonella sp.]|uniref:pseudouridine synthase n=1 Tax=Dokdonella sp. TaxID=2291710 RepID=UPI0025BE2637|nr:pseudouridine synthase [Dokdonella sp.]MBX3692979.1 rRNA pseudouridine synthase [Dokdonella sp.]MCW5566707.1 rRNA pseudouridine synthase [Dokdonella sp.]
MNRTGKPSHGLARVLSRRGLCSRAEAERLARAGRVRVDGRVVRDPHARTPADAGLAIDDVEVVAPTRRYVMLNKPRGLVTTRSDEQGRATVYSMLGAAGADWLAPVGRLDKASEGLLLFSNDSAWAAAITSPESVLGKTYHVQVDCLPGDDLLASLRAGVVDRGETLLLKSVRELRRGERNAWLEVTLDEGRNRQIRRVLAGFGIGVLRLVRVAIGPLVLGDLAKGAWRELSSDEVEALVPRQTRPGRRGSPIRD